MSFKSIDYNLKALSQGQPPLKPPIQDQIHNDGFTMLPHSKCSEKISLLSPEFGGHKWFLCGPREITSVRGDHFIFSICLDCGCQHYLFLYHINCSVKCLMMKKFQAWLWSLGFVIFMRLHPVFWGGGAGQTVNADPSWTGQMKKQNKRNIALTAMWFKINTIYASVD